MALVDLIQIIEKACKDPAFKARLEVSFDEALKGFELTEEEKEAIKEWAEAEVLV